MAARSVLRTSAARRRTVVDPVTRGIELALSLSLLEHADTAFWVQGVTLLLVGILTFSSVRGIVVQTMYRDDEMPRVRSQEILPRRQAVRLQPQVKLQESSFTSPNRRRQLLIHQEIHRGPVLSALGVQVWRRR